MNVELAVAERLMADAAVAALVGSRVYVVKLPQRVTYPAVRVQLVDQPQRYHLRGEDELTRARVQIDAYASEDAGGNPYTSADNVADAIEASLSGKKFRNTGSPEEIEITGCFREDRRAMYDPDELRLVRILQDFMVWSRQVA